MEMNKAVVPTKQSIWEVIARRFTAHKALNQLAAIIKGRSLPQTVQAGTVGQSNNHKSRVNKVHPNRHRADPKDRISANNSGVDPSHHDLTWYTQVTKKIISRLHIYPVFHWLIGCYNNECTSLNLC